MIFSSKKFLMSLVVVSLSVLLAAPSCPSVIQQAEQLQQAKEFSLHNFLGVFNPLYKNVPETKSFLRALLELEKDQADGLPVRDDYVFKMLKEFYALPVSVRNQVLKVGRSWVIHFCDSVPGLIFYDTIPSDEV